MNTFPNNYDALEQLIFEQGLRIRGLHFHPELDLILIVLNNKKVMKRNLSEFPKLARSSKSSLNNYELIGEGAGVHWPEMDEDRSLKEFLSYELSRMDQPVESLKGSVK